MSCEQEDYMKIKLCSTYRLPNASGVFLCVTRVGDDYTFPKAKYTFHALTWELLILQAWNIRGLSCVAISTLVGVFSPSPMPLHQMREGCNITSCTKLKIFRSMWPLLSELMEFQICQDWNHNYYKRLKYHISYSNQQRAVVDKSHVPISSPVSKLVGCHAYNGSQQTG